MPPPTSRAGNADPDAEELLGAPEQAGEQQAAAAVEGQVYTRRKMRAGIKVKTRKLLTRATAASNSLRESRLEEEAPGGASLIEACVTLQLCEAFLGEAKCQAALLSRCESTEKLVTSVDRLRRELGLDGGPNKVLAWLHGQDGGCAATHAEVAQVAAALHRSSRWWVSVDYSAETTAWLERCLQWMGHTWWVAIHMQLQLQIQEQAQGQGADRLEEAVGIPWWRAGYVMGVPV